MQAELLGDKPKPQLLKGAAPTLFLHNNFKANVPKRRVFSEQRKIRKEKEEVLVTVFLCYFLEYSQTLIQRPPTKRPPLAILKQPVIKVPTL